MAQPTLAEPTLPISVIGPEPPSASLGSITVETANAQPQFTSIPGEKNKPAPMVPPEVDMSEVLETRFANYLDYEVFQCRSERMEFVNRLARFKEKYRTKFPDFPKDWPIANASQIIIPVIRTAVHTLGARIYQTLMAAEPLLSMRVDDQDYQDFAFDYEKFLDRYLDEKLDMANLLDGWVTEAIKLGTAVFEVSTKVERRAFVSYDPGTSQYSKQIIDAFNGPIVYHVPLEDFWIRPAFQDPEQAPWCGKEVRWTWSQIKDMANSGELNPERIDRLWRWVGATDLLMPKTVLKQEDIESLRPNDRRVFNIHELAVRWDVDGDGIEEELIVYFHQPSRTILRKKFSGFRRRPWRVGRYIPIEHWFYGEGLCEILEHLQEEISTIHNQRIDNATIANLRVILVSRLIQGLRPGDRLWTGKIVRVNDVKADVGTLQLGDVYPSTVANETMANQYAERLSGAGEAATGQARPVSRTTATAQLALLEELNRRFDKVVKGMRRTLRAVGDDLTTLFLKSGTGGLAEEWLGAMHGQRLEQFLAMPEDLIRKKLKLHVQATRSTVNREVEFQSQIAVFQLLNQLGQNVLQLGQQLTPQAVPLLAHELVKAYLPVFKKVMQYADAPDPDQAISVLTVLERILPAPEDMGGMGQAQSDQAQALIEQLAQRVRGQLGAGGGTQGTEGQSALPFSGGATSPTLPGGVGLPDTSGGPAGLQVSQGIPGRTR